MRRAGVAGIRQSLGPAWTDMICLSCGQARLQGLIDRRGGAYVSCSICRFRILSVDLATMGRLRFLGKLLTDDAVRRTWAKEGADAIVFDVPERVHESVPVEVKNHG